MYTIDVELAKCSAFEGLDTEWFHVGKGASFHRCLCEGTLDHGIGIAEKKKGRKRKFVW